MVPWQQINASAPFAQAFKDRGAMWMSIIVSFGGLAGAADTCTRMSASYEGVALLGWSVIVRLFG
jgi:hypothetical protein